MASIDTEKFRSTSSLGRSMTIDRYRINHRSFQFLENDIENINEHDLVTGMNLLHFTCKYGAKKIEQERKAIDVLNLLIKKGINLTVSCLWIQMNCLHYCAFFDSPSILEVLLDQPNVSACKATSHSNFSSIWFSFNLVLNQACPSFENQTPLHLACSALSLETARILLKAGANDQIIDDRQRTPKDCLPSGKNDPEGIAEKIRALLHQQQEPTKMTETMTENLFDSIIESESQNLPQFQIDERVRLTNNKVRSILSYFFIR